MSGSALRIPRAGRLAIAALLIASVAGDAHANLEPNVERGFDPAKVYQFGEVDHVNLFNGNLTLTIPIGGSYPVNGGLSYGLTLVYNSNVWDLISIEVNGPQGDGGGSSLEARPNRFSNAGLGWMLSMGELEPPPHWDHPDHWLFVGPDGAEHTFHPKLHDTDSGTSATVGYTRDGSYLRLQVLVTNHPQLGDLIDVEAGDGTVRRFQRPPGALDFRFDHLRDRFGNQVSAIYSPDGMSWTLTDGHRSQRVVFTTLLGRKVVDHVELSAFGGTTATYDFQYDTSADLHVTCLDTEPETDERIWLPLLSRVVLPDGSSWSVTGYHRECVPQTPLENLPGAIQGLTLPTGGSIAWTYREYRFPSRSPGLPTTPGLVSINTAVGVASKTWNGLGDQGCFQIGEVGCTWSYEPSAPTATPGRTTRVTYPSGDATVFHFSQDVHFGPQDASNGHPLRYSAHWHYGLPFRPPTLTLGQPAPPGPYLSQEIYEKQGGTLQLVRRVLVEYERDLLPNVCDRTCQDQWLVANARPFRERTEFVDDPVNPQVPNVLHYVEATSSDFDGLGHYRRRVVGGSLPGTETQTTHTRFNKDRGTFAVDVAANVFASGHSYTVWPAADPWVLGTFDRSWSEQAGSPRLWSQACFDPATGFLKRERRVEAAGGTSGPTLGGEDVLVVYTPHLVDPDGPGPQSPRATGNVAREAYFGGDGDSQPTGALCDLTPSGTADVEIEHDYLYGGRIWSRYLKADGTPMEFKSVDRDLDPRTALPVRSRDVAGVATEFSYDAMGRLTAVRPADDGWTSYTWTRAQNSNVARVKIETRLNGATSGPTLTEAEVTFDAFGRPAKDRRRMPGGVWTTVETRTNSMGWKDRVSEREAVASPVHVTKFTDFDAFGRPRSIEPPDGPGHKVTLSYQGARAVHRKVKIATAYDPGSGQITESDAGSSEFYDAHGRLVRVQEFSDPATPAEQVRTLYGYDAADRLTSVSTTASGVTQQRFFSYDGRGFLLSEQHPEKGAFGNGQVGYSAFDARGHAGRRLEGTADGPFDLVYSYDRAERLREVREHLDPPGSPEPRKLKVFEYGTLNQGTNRRLGKLTSAARTNWVFNPANGGTAEIVVTESYAYAGDGGRVSLRTTTTNLADPHSFTQSWTWDDLGQLASVVYPKCLFGPCVNAAHDRTQSFTRSDGLLTAVPGFASSITYHPNGLFHQISHTNGVTYTQGADASGMRRPGRFDIAGNSSACPNSEADFTEGGGLPYLYDGAGNPKAIGAERYVYDRVGRVMKGWMGPSLGNLENSQAYTYDPFGNLRTITTTRDGVEENRTLAVTAATNRLTGAGIGYDVAGNQTGWAEYAYEWDAFGMMKRMTGAGNASVYVYTADDERLWTIDYSVTPWRQRFTLRDLDGSVLRVFAADADYGGPWTVDQDYIRRDGALLATVKIGESGQPETWHQHPDHLGTPRMQTSPRNGSNQVCSIFNSYFPFGERLTPTLPADRMQFTGHERDVNGEGETDDLDYMHARYCSPLTGRFLGVDPVMGDPREPQAWNRYSYARSSPLLFNDPTGEYVCTGTSDQCEKFEKARQENLQSDKEVLQQTAQVYGDPGADNGVTVRFGDPGTGKSASVAMSITASVDSSGSVAITLKSTVTVRDGVRGSELRAAVAHEGSHITDGNAFAASFSPSGTFWNDALNITGSATETRAYAITAEVANSSNTSFRFNGATFKRMMPAREIEMLTGRILKADYKKTYLDGRFIDWPTLPKAP